MKRNTVDRVLLGLSVAAFLGMSASFPLMLLEGMKILPGLLFWAGLVLGSALQAVLAARRRKLFYGYGMKPRKMQKARNGLLSMGSNPLAIVADTGFVFGLVTTVLVFVFTEGMGELCYVFLGITVFAFCMHCILNGRIYLYVTNYHKIRQALEEKKSQKEREKK